MTTSRKDLIEFQKKHDIRADWHEPDNQGIIARVTGTHLDNAMGEQVTGEELVVILYVESDECGLSEGIRINLANLLSMAITPFVRDTEVISDE